MVTGQVRATLSELSRTHIDMQREMGIKKLWPCPWFPDGKGGIDALPDKRLSDEEKALMQRVVESVKAEREGGGG